MKNLLTLTDYNKINNFFLNSFIYVEDEYSVFMFYYKISKVKIINFYTFL